MTIAVAIHLSILCETGADRCFSIAFPTSVGVMISTNDCWLSLRTTGSLPTPFEIILVNAEKRSSSGELLSWTNFCKS
jgi:hypothetical protein